MNVNEQMVDMKTDAEKKLVTPKNYQVYALISVFCLMLTIAFTVYNYNISHQKSDMVEVNQNNLSSADQKIVSNILSVNDKFFNDKKPLFTKIKQSEMSVVNKRGDEGFEEYRLDYNDKQNTRSMFNYFFAYDTDEREIALWNLNPQQCKYLFNYYSNKNIYVETFDFVYTEGLKNRGKQLSCDDFNKNNPNAVLFIEV